jgi:hypothetical protein
MIEFIKAAGSGQMEQARRFFYTLFLLRTLPSFGAWRQYGRSSPKREFIKAFAEAFELTPQERSELAWAYAYDSRPEHEGLALVELRRASDRL